MSRILVVEDESHIAQGLRFNLEAEGHSVEVTEKGEEALQRLLHKHEKFDLLVLDVMLPGQDGFTVARELRRAHHYIPLLMLTARGRPEDVLKGFEPEAFSFNGKTVDFQRLQLRARDQVFQLTLMESELLRYLIRNSGRPITRKEILEQVWDLHEDTDTRAIDNFIVRLRRYIEEKPSRPRHLLTVRGLGYQFVPEPKN
jgi:DNA-binding response OmpR family regulator